VVEAVPGSPPAEVVPRRSALALRIPECSTTGAVGAAQRTEEVESWSASLPVRYRIAHYLVARRMAGPLPRENKRTIP
jgi:hypothetical protein